MTVVSLITATCRTLSRGEERAYFAFDLLFLDGHDLRRCPIEYRKALLRQALNGVGCSHLIYIEHIVGRGADLFERVRAIGADETRRITLQRWRVTRLAQDQMPRHRPVRRYRLPGTRSR